MTAPRGRRPEDGDYKGHKLAGDTLGAFLAFIERNGRVYLDGRGKPSAKQAEGFRWYYDKLKGDES